MQTSYAHFTCELNPRMGGVLTGLEITTTNLAKFGIMGTIISLGNSKEATRNLGARLTRLNSIGVDSITSKSMFTNSYGIGWNFGIHKKLKDRSTYSLVVLHQIYTFSTYIGYRYAKQNGIPFAVFPHGSLTRYHESDSRFIKRIAKSLIISRILKACSAIIVTCDGELEDLEASLRSKAILIPYGATVEATEVPIDSWEPKNPENFRLVFSGRFDKKKNIPLLLEAIRLLVIRYPQVVLDIAGSGSLDENEFYSRLVKKLRIENNVVFHGWVEKHQLNKLISSARALVLPSENENFALVVSEALCVGVPCVVSRFVGTSDIVAKHNAGVVISELSPQVLAAGIEKVFRGDQNGYRDAAFKATREELDWSKIACSWKNLPQILA